MFVFAYFKLHLRQKIRKNDKRIMKKSILMLMAILFTISCSDKKEQKTKAPTSVNTEVVSAIRSGLGQTYVGIVEEQEATAVSFTGMGVVRRCWSVKDRQSGKAS